MQISRYTDSIKITYKNSRYLLKIFILVLLFTPLIYVHIFVYIILTISVLTYFLSNIKDKIVLVGNFEIILIDRNKRTHVLIEEINNIIVEKDQIEQTSTIYFLTDTKKYRFQTDTNYDDVDLSVKELEKFIANRSFNIERNITKNKENNGGTISDFFKTSPPLKSQEKMLYSNDTLIVKDNYYIVEKRVSDKFIKKEKTNEGFDFSHVKKYFLSTNDKDAVEVDEKLFNEATNNCEILMTYENKSNKLIKFESLFLKKYKIKENKECLRNSTKKEQHKFLNQQQKHYINWVRNVLISIFIGNGIALYMKKTIDNNYTLPIIYCSLIILLILTVLSKIIIFFSKNKEKNGIVETQYKINRFTVFDAYTYTDENADKRQIIKSDDMEYFYSELICKTGDYVEVIRNTLTDNILEIKVLEKSQLIESSEN